MKTLTRAEEQVMQVLWSLQKGFLKEVLERAPEPKPHPNTVATILKILVEKGFAGFELRGRNYLYFGKISREDYGKRSINQVIKGYFGDSPARLVSQLVSDNKLSVEELEALLQQIKASRKTS